MLPRVCGSARQGTLPGASALARWATPMRVLACARLATLTSAFMHVHEETQRHVSLVPEWRRVDRIETGSGPQNSIKRRAAHRQHQRFVCRHGGNGRGRNARPDVSKLPRSVRSAAKRSPKSVKCFVSKRSRTRGLFVSKCPRPAGLLATSQLATRTSRVFAFGAFKGSSCNVRDHLVSRSLRRISGLGSRSSRMVPSGRR